MATTAREGDAAAAHDEYLQWAIDEAGVEAPKVTLRLRRQVGDDGGGGGASSATAEDAHETSEERGLYAKETIETGELILRVPAEYLLGSTFFERAYNERVAELEDGGDRPPSSVHLHRSASSATRQELELELVLLVESFRRSIVGDDANDDRIKEAISLTRYEWREDDGFVLYLVGARHLLRQNVDDQQKAPSTNTTFPSLLPHVAVLPTSFPTVPLFYSDDQLDHLDGTNCHGYTVKMKAQLERDHDKLVRVLGSWIDDTIGSEPDDDCFWCKELLRALTLDSYMWACSNVYSRATDLPILGDSGDPPSCQRRRVMAPLFDMLNHNPDSDVVHGLDERDGSLVVHCGASKPIEAGDEICFSYGPFANEKLLFVYGFLVEDNPRDAVAIYVPLTSVESDPLYNLRCTLLQVGCGMSQDEINSPHLIAADAAALTNNDDDENTGRSGVLPASLLSVLRVVGVQTGDELLQLIEEYSQGDDDEEGAKRGIGTISSENEIAALTALRQALDGMSRKVALNLLGLESLARGGEESGSGDDAIDRINLCNATVLCGSEHRILREALTEISRRLVALGVGDY